jgi:predicted dehydrogenase
VRILVVGCGSIGRRHAANAAALAETAVVDVDEAIARRCGEAHGVPAFPDLASGLSWRPDGVVVATPHDTHLEVAAAAIEAGADVLIEKPISHDARGVDAFLDRAEALGRRTFVVCNLRFHPAVATLRRHLADIGRPLFARAQYGNYLPDMRPGADYRALYCARRERGGGVILDGIHEIDYLAWFFGPVEAVACEAAKVSGLDIDVEDYASVCLRHVSGVRSEIHLDYVQRAKRRSCEIVGTEGTLVWLSEGKAPERCTVRLYQASEKHWVTVFASDAVDSDRTYAELVSRFMATLNGEGTELLTGRGGAAGLAIALAAKKAAESGKIAPPDFHG